MTDNLTSHGTRFGFSAVWQSPWAAPVFLVPFLLMLAVHQLLGLSDALLAADEPGERPAAWVQSPVRREHEPMHSCYDPAFPREISTRTFLVHRQTTDPDGPFLPWLADAGNSVVNGTGHRHRDCLLNRSPQNEKRGSRSGDPGTHSGMPRRGRNIPARGNAPGTGSPTGNSPERAAQVRGTTGFVSPFQGSAWGGRRDPGALPRADLFWPLRGKNPQQCHRPFSFAFPIARTHLAFCRVIDFSNSRHTDRFFEGFARPLPPADGSGLPSSAWPGRTDSRRARIAAA